ncbi:MAG: universal stress protein [Betaproteobacteria bacterium]|nr:universal stress protein [Betaproteobacteria bacterium]
MFKRVLFALDGSAASRRATGDIGPIAHLSHGSVKLLAVLPIPLDTTQGWAAGVLGEFPSIQTPLRDEGASMMLKLEIERLEAMNITVQGDVVFGDPVEEIVRAAQAFHADLIVLGHQRYNSWIERWWRGTTAEAVIERAHCNVFISIHD